MRCNESSTLNIKMSIFFYYIFAPPFQINFVGLLNDNTNICGELYCLLDIIQFFVALKYIVACYSHFVGNGEKLKPVLQKIFDTM